MAGAVTLPRYRFGADGTAGHAVFIGDHRVAKLVVMSSARRTCDQLVVETELGEVFLRSLDGRMNPLLPHKDLFYDPERQDAPAVVIT